MLNVTTNTRTSKGGNNLQDFNILSISSGAAGAILGYIFGEWDALLQVLVWLIVVDYLSGLASAYSEGLSTPDKGLSSRVGFKGIAKKVMILILCAASAKVDQIAGTSIVREAVIFFYIGNELLSLLENAGRIGLPVPKKLKDAVAVLKSKEDDDDTQKGA